MSDGSTFTPEEITAGLKIWFAATLIISTLGFILYGVVVCQFVTYLQVLARKDHVLTTALVCVVAIFTSAANFYQVYFNWTFSIALTSSDPNKYKTRSIINGNIVVMYSTVVMLVQMFYLGVIRRMMSSNPRLNWLVIIPIALASLASFTLAIAVGVISRIRVAENGGWPTPESSPLLRTLLGLDLGIDLSILVIIISQLTVLKRRTLHHKTSVSKLSWILCGVTLASTLVIIAELYVDFPEVGIVNIPIVITFAPLIPNIYACGILSVLNARADLWSSSRTTQQLPSGDSKSSKLIPGLKFTKDLPDEKENSRTPSPSNHAMTFINTLEQNAEA